MSLLVEMPKEQWDEYRADLQKRVRAINIPTDVNPAIAINILSTIDNIYSVLRLDYSDLESTKERIDLMIKEIEKVGLTGKNEDERRRNSVLAVQEKTEDGLTLYDIQRETNTRYNFIRGALDVLVNKQNRLITINGLLKLDKDLMVSQGSFSSMAASSAYN